MPPVTTVIEVALAGFALSLSPGPSMLFVLSRTVGQGRCAGLASTIGLAIGGVILAVITAFGMSALIRNSELAVTLLTFAGAAYLVYLGVTQIIEARVLGAADFRPSAVAEKGFWHILAQAIFVEALNPKTILFFVLFISRFLDQDAGGLWSQALIYGMLVPLTAIPADMMVVLLGNRLSYVVKSKPKLQYSMLIGAGLILIGIGLSLFI